MTGFEAGRPSPPRTTLTSVRIPGPCRPARYQDRPNKLECRAWLEPEDELVAIQLPTPGGLTELLASSARLWVRAAEHTQRPSWVLAIIETREGVLIGVDPEPARALVAAGIQNDDFPELAGFEVSRADVASGTSRFDLELESHSGGSMLASIYSVSLTANHVGLFPDVPLPRASRQIRTLARRADSGQPAAIFFIVQRIDVGRVMPSRHIDSELTEALREAQLAGVRIIGRRCQVTLEELVLGVSVEVKIPAPARSGSRS